MKKIFFMLSVPLLLLSCQDVEKTVTVTRFTADSTLFTLEADYFAATLTRDSTYSKGKADGPSSWERIGSLSFILSELYGNPVEMEETARLQYHYKLDINWDEQTSFESIRRNVAKKIKETVGYYVKSETREQPKYVLSVKNMSELQKGKETGFAKDGVTYKTSLKNENWRIYSSLNKFAEFLTKQTDRMVEVKKDYGSTAYYFELTTSGGFDNLISQLEENYGLAFQKKMITEKYYVINFK